MPWDFPPKAQIPPSGFPILKKKIVLCSHPNGIRSPPPPTHLVTSKTVIRYETLGMYNYSCCHVRYITYTVHHPAQSQNYMTMFSCRRQVNVIRNGLQEGFWRTTLSPLPTSHPESYWFSVYQARPFSLLVLHTQGAKRKKV